ncbi:MAG: adenylyltransferase/cytidyltransferase family protein [Candidatus Xiphinematobacter sp.]|nr:MAG: adenylyltransferase/cytidyltransferase family protein [Candidatus Xiphinematobacter sp.]
MATILPLENLAAFAGSVHRQGMRLVLTNGCFDLLHIGHVRYLQQARSLGDFLLVAVNSDASARALKGIERPVNTQEDRAEIIAAIRCVDCVTIFDSLRATQVIREVCPVLYVKGGDYTLDALDQEETTALIEVGAEIRFTPRVFGYSTTTLISRLR